VFDLPKYIQQSAAALGTSWQTAFSAVGGSLVLYIVGYVVLRFHLTALGVGTDLGLRLMDERYFFAGAKFLVYLIAAVPNLLILLLPLAAVAHLLSRLVPVGARAAVRGWAGGLSTATLTWTGVVIAVLVIQLAMRQVFNFSNLLVAPSVKAPGWLVCIACDGTRLALYFSGLIAACALSAALLFLAGARGSAERPATGGFLLLGFLLAVELSFLPLTYGQLIFDKYLARVATLAGGAPLQAGQQAWLVWETESSVTYLVEESGGSRALVTLPSSEVKRKVITGYDFLLRRFFPDACRS